MKIGLHQSDIDFSVFKGQKVEECKLSNCYSITAYERAAYSLGIKDKGYCDDHQFLTIAITMRATVMYRCPVGYCFGVAELCV